MINIMYMGQKPIGELCFRQLVSMKGEKLNIKALVSNQSRDKVWWKTNNIYKYALENQIPFIDNEARNFDKIIELIKEKEINFIISVGHNWIISEDILALVNYKAVNLHLAKLPEYQGNFTFNHAILNGEKEYGVTLHWMQREVDEGDYLFIPVFPIEENDTAFSLYNKSLDEGQKVFHVFIEYLLNDKELPRKKMAGKKCFYDRHSLDGLREIENVNDIKLLKRKSNAFYFPPFENAYVKIDGKKYYVIPDNENK